MEFYVMVGKVGLWNMVRKLLKLMNGVDVRFYRF